MSLARSLRVCDQFQLLTLWTAQCHDVTMGARFYAFFDFYLAFVPSEIWASWIQDVRLLDVIIPPLLIFYFCQRFSPFQQMTKLTPGLTGQYCM